MVRRCILVLSVLFLFCFGLVGWAQNQDSSNDAARRVVERTPPVYPATAKRLNLGGTVKVLAVVAPNGSVKKVEPVGGSPLLIQAAEDAISHWKYAPASAESREVIELHFNPRAQ